MATGEGGREFGFVCLQGVTEGVVAAVAVLGGGDCAVVLSVVGVGVDAVVMDFVPVVGIFVCELDFTSFAECHAACDHAFAVHFLVTPVGSVE